MFMYTCSLLFLYRAPYSRLWHVVFVYLYQEKGKDDETGEELVRREDDQPEVRTNVK